MQFVLPFVLPRCFKEELPHLSGNCFALMRLRSQVSQGLSLSQARFGSPGLPETHHLDRRDGGLVSVHTDLSEADLS